MFSALLSRLDRLQKSRLFKIVATAVVVLAVTGLVVAYAVDQARMTQDRLVIEEPSEADLSRMSPEDRKVYEEAREIQQITVKSFNQLMESQTDVSTVIVGGLLLMVPLLAVIWLGIALYAIMLVVFVSLVAAPMIVLGNERWGRIGRFVAGVSGLGMSFLVLMQALKALFSPSWAVTAIARNVVMEATRMRVSIVFILLLLFALAALPGLLDPDTPLRYRVQSFLQYGTSITFWIIATLTLFLSVATVAFEQRDKIIWQTMTKPVTAWEYLLGKWLGVVGVAAVLLGVCATGVFMFTQYLSQQPAQGEIAPFVSLHEGEFVTEDRAILQSQVLTARRSVPPDFAFDLRRLEAEAMQKRIADALKADPNFRLTEELQEQYTQAVQREVRAGFSAVGPGEAKQFTFSGLKQARDAGRFVTLRYKMDVGANDPRTIYDILFLFKNVDVSRVQQVPAGQRMTIQVPPAAIDPDGRLYVVIGNGRPITNTILQPNPQTIGFPPDGLDVFYPAGSYRINFLRVVIVQWLKIAFLAMVGIVSATFLSFAVASLVSFGIFLIAETATFLFSSLENYSHIDEKGQIDYFAAVVRGIAWPVANTFKYYADLSPTGKLVDGLLIPWFTVLKAAVILGSATTVLFFIGVGIFRKRELATYSGQ